MSPFLGLLPLIAGCNAATLFQLFLDHKDSAFVYSAGCYSDPKQIIYSKY